MESLTQTALLLASSSLILAQQPSAQERAVALKASLTASQAILRQYQWVETTVVSVKGEEKSRQMNRCYYGADGNVQKVPLTTPPPAAKKRGLRGRIAEAKKEELTDYMKEAVGLVKLYMPPEPASIQAAKDAGRVTIQPQPGQQARLTLPTTSKPVTAWLWTLIWRATARSQPKCPPTSIRRKSRSRWTCASARSTTVRPIPPTWSWRRRAQVGGHRRKLRLSEAVITRQPIP